MVNNLNFGEASKAAEKEGKLICREGWNGKGQFVFVRPEDELSVDFIINKVKSLPQSLKDYYKGMFVDVDTSEKVNPADVMVKFRAYLCLKCADGTIMNGWTPNTLDALANDWCILD